MSLYSLVGGQWLTTRRAKMDAHPTRSLITHRIYKINIKFIEFYKNLFFIKTFTFQGLILACSGIVANMPKK
jgi:hypothetical protein